MRGVVRRWGRARPAAMVTANDLLVRAGDHHPNAGRTGIDDVHIPAEMVADLYHPFLIITPDYVGPPRRAPREAGRRATDHGPEGRPQRGAGGPRPRTGGRRPSPIRPLVATVALTAAVVAPLTLLVAHLVAH
jgi:hypothetical protein